MERDFSAVSSEDKHRKVTINHFVFIDSASNDPF